MRTITFPEDIGAMLKSLSERRRCSEAAIIRLSIVEMYEREGRK